MHPRMIIFETKNKKKTHLPVPSSSFSAVFSSRQAPISCKDSENSGIAQLIDCTTERGHWGSVDILDG